MQFTNVGLSFTMVDYHIKHQGYALLHDEHWNRFFVYDYLKKCEVFNSIYQSTILFIDKCSSLKQKINYFKVFLSETILYNHPTHKYLVLRPELWLLQVSMYEFYFYLMWWINTLYTEPSIYENNNQLRNYELDILYQCIGRFFDMHNKIHT